MGGVVGAIAAVAIVVLVVLFVLLAPKRGRRRGDEEDGIGMKRKNQRIVEKASDASTASRGGGGGPSYVSVGEAIAKSYAQPYKAPRGSQRPSAVPGSMRTGQASLPKNASQQRRKGVTDEQRSKACRGWGAI